MANTVSFDTNAILRVAQTKVPSSHKKAIDLTLRNRCAFPMLKKWGRMKLGIDISVGQYWNARVDLPEDREWPNNPDQDYDPGPAQDRYFLDIGSRIVTDSISEQDLARVAGSKTQIIDLYADNLTAVNQAMGNGLNKQFIEGTGTYPQMGGLNYVLSAATATPATDIVARPTGTYATQNMTPGVLGTWTSDLATAPNATIGTDFPNGSGSSIYDAHTPLRLVINGAWPETESSEWASNCTEILQYLQGVMKKRGAAVVDSNARFTLLMGEILHRQLKRFLEARHYSLEPVAEATRMGMPDTFNYEGLWFKTDSDVPDNRFYGLQPDMMEFYTAPLYPDMWKTDVFEFSPESRSLYKARTMANFRFQPKFLCDGQSY